MKLLKKALIGIVVLLTLIIIGAIIAINVIVDEKFVASQITNVTDRQVNIGSISQNISLSPSVSLKNVVIKNAEWGKAADFINAGELKIKLELLPLLQGNYNISSITLKDANISMETKGSKNNYSFNNEDNSAEEAVEEKTDLNLKFDKILIENLSVSMLNNGKQDLIVLKSLEIKSGEELAKLAVKVNASGTDISLTSDVTPLDKIIAEPLIELKNMNISALKLNTSGNLKIDATKKTPYISGNLYFPEIDLDKFSSDTKEVKSDKLFPDTEIPFATLNAFNADIELNIKTMKAGIRAFENFKTSIKVSGDSLSLNKLSSNFGQGTIKGSAKLSPKGSNLNLNADKVIAGPSILGNDFVGGITNVTANLNTYGTRIDTLIKSISGETSFLMKNAKYKGEAKSSGMQQLLKLLSGGTVSDSTEVNCAIANVNWKSGIGEINAFALDTDFAKATGTGEIKLPQEKMHLVLNPSAKNVGLADLAVPIRISGSFNDIGFYPDPQGTAISIGKTVFGVVTGTALITTFGPSVAEKLGINLGEDDACANALKGNPPTSSGGNAEGEKKTEGDNPVNNLLDNIKLPF